MAKKRNRRARPPASSPPAPGRSRGGNQASRPARPAPRAAGGAARPAQRPADRTARPTRRAASVPAGYPAVVRGASWGFSVLLVGELVALQLLGLATGLALYVVAAAAYALAGNRAVRPPVVSGSRAARDGAAAAALAYALTIPLRLIVRSSVTVTDVVVALAFAAAVGGAAGFIAGRARLRNREE